MDVLGPLTVIAHGNQHVLGISHWLSELRFSILPRTTTAFVVTSAFLCNSIYVYGAPGYVLTDKGPQFGAKFFHAIYSFLGARHYLTTDYHPHTNGKTEKFTRTLVKRLRDYFEEHQSD